MKYDHASIEKKWQEKWDGPWQKLFQADDASKKKKCYLLVEFPYPSGEGLHMGHPRSYVAMDIVARKRRMEGQNVLYPIGWDAFGLPAENYAIKAGLHPKVTTQKNIETFRRQLKALGISFDWSREVDTTDPAYYKWTQWMFLQFFKHDLAYKAKMPINWCLSCKIGLANEEVVDGRCERCGGEIEKRDKEQWMIRITKYADRLLEDLNTVDYLSKIKKQQEDWIGRKEGINITYQIEGSDKTVMVFTTRPDTNFGATFVVLAPEHELTLQIATRKLQDEVRRYVEQAKKKRESERLAEGRQKTGVFTGRYAINHLTGRKMPIWVSDFVLGSFGTGAVVGVPGHDLRDFEFAQEFGIETRRVVIGADGDTSLIVRPEQVQEDVGVMVNSGFLDGLEIHEATKRIMDYMEKKGWGKRVVQYKLRDWVFSRQRYWGEPIPMIYCGNCATGGISNVIMIHGSSGARTDRNSPDYVVPHRRHWHGWFEDQLKAKGYRVDNPDMPTDWAPNYDEWKQVMDTFEVGENTILVGTSAGAVFILKWLLNNGKKVKEVILNAPAYLSTDGDERTKEFRDFELDPKLRKQTDELTIFISNDKPEIVKSAHLIAKKLRGNLIELDNRGHFCIWDNPMNAQFPELLAEVVGNSGGWKPVPEDDLPVLLPEVEKYQPTDTGESPLAAIDEWVNVKCPQCGGSARRETDVMPNWAGSSWYFLRYIDPRNDKKFADKKKLKKWMPVDWYNGGMEHTTLHLLYSRFWNKFLYDFGVVPTSEPYAKRTSHGLILGEDGEKMSKSRGNVVNPDEIIKQYGADSLRCYQMFIGPFDQAAPWNSRGVVGVRRFLERVYGLVDKVERSNLKPQTSNLPRIVHQTTKKVSDDIEAMKFNTAVSQMMVCANAFADAEKIPPELFELFVRVLSPFAPHLTEELWEKLGHKESVMTSPWPVYDPELAKEQEIELVVQINGKVRDTITVPTGLSDEELKTRALASEKTKQWLAGKTPQKVMVVKGKLVSIVV